MLTKQPKKLHIQYPRESDTSRPLVPYPVLCHCCHDNGDSAGPDALSLPGTGTSQGEAIVSQDFGAVRKAGHPELT